MSDEHTPDVTPDAEVDPTTAATQHQAPAEAPAPDGTAKGRRGRHRVGKPAPGAAPDATEATEPGEAPVAASATAEAGPVDDEATTGAAAEAVVEASTNDGASGDLKDPELFDPAEVANAPRAPHPLKPVVEALIFASPEPLTIKAMARLLEEHTKDEIEAALAEVRETYLKSDGLQLVEVAGGFQIVTRPELYEWVRRLFKERTTSKLSVQALETLAVIAYKQPVTSGEIAEIRGVSATTGVLNTLLDRKLVKIVGRKQVVGRPFMYGTTREFLDKFGLRDLADLPKVEDMSEALGFDLPSPVDEDDGVSLPFEEPGPVEPLLFEAAELQPAGTAADAVGTPAPAPVEEEFVAMGPEAEPDAPVLDADATGPDGTSPEEEH
ncbi:hypothetical protein TBR22_A34350 [Luteitalea sp. TBR-22]|uniref:SMC-Scp complex subunit ScpB n=1 Tax=Luteitalea sp. TBR-22 TaxID=2802971 RepID=UPI001AF72692|nr:SMC-Scp complex subunit ScpB [Luteitalea sp. TBR-22]BCS34206.1 hypothetical protein TBR22_A34350 [Luteitalea sp. TBR-22]